MEQIVETKAIPVNPTLSRSDDISALATALAVAQSKITFAPKTSQNPHFKSKYADLAAVWEACREPLTSQGLSILQIPSGRGREVKLTTILMHKSGQFISGEMTAIAADEKPQTIGSCLTYIRRYSLSAFAGIAQDDDDGNAASGRGDSPTGFVKSGSSAVSRPQQPSKEDRSSTMLAAFKALKVTPYQVEDFMGKKLADFDDADFEAAQGFYQDVKTGKIKIADKTAEALAGAFKEK